MEKSGLDELLAFGPPSDVESFNAGFNSAQAQLTHGGDAELISAPKGRLTEVVGDVAEQLEAEREPA